MEVLTLHAARQWAGAGSALLAAARRVAEASGVRRVWLVTTNDNVDALRFYQRRGYRLSGVDAGAVDRSRAALKPAIPEVGAHGIPLRDEIELELLIGDASGPPADATTLRRAGARPGASRGGRDPRRLRGRPGARLHRDRLERPRLDPRRDPRSASCGAAEHLDHDRGRSSSSSSRRMFSWRPTTRSHQVPTAPRSRPPQLDLGARRRPLAAPASTRGRRSHSTRTTGQDDAGRVALTVAVHRRHRHCRCF